MEKRQKQKQPTTIKWKWTDPIAIYSEIKLLLITWTSPLPVKGFLVGIFHFYSIFDKPFRLHVVRCLPVSNKKDAMLTWV